MQLGMLPAYIRELHKMVDGVQEPQRRNSKEDLDLLDAKKEKVEVFRRRWGSSLLSLIVMLIISISRHQSNKSLRIQKTKGGIIAKTLSTGRGGMI